MQKAIEFLSGKKTYIIAGVTFILAGLQAIGYPIPEYVYALLGACGVATVRAAVGKVG